VRAADAQRNVEPIRSTGHVMNARRLSGLYARSVDTLSMIFGYTG
jgi:hypothetical protein